MLLPQRGAVGAPTTWWRDDAACRELDRERFYGPNTAWAKRVCATCPVRVPCLAFALAIGDRQGVWGGTDPDERHELARVTCGTPDRRQAGCRCVACEAAWSRRHRLVGVLRNLVRVTAEDALLDTGSRPAV